MGHRKQMTKRKNNLRKTGVNNRQEKVQDRVKLMDILKIIIQVLSKSY